MRKKTDQHSLDNSPYSSDICLFDVMAAEKVTIPARPFLGLSSENEREIVDLATGHFGAGA